MSGIGRIRSSIHVCSVWVLSPKHQVLDAAYVVDEGRREAIRKDMRQLLGELRARPEPS